MDYQDMFNFSSVENFESSKSCKVTVASRLSRLQDHEVQLSNLDEGSGSLASASIALGHTAAKGAQWGPNLILNVHEFPIQAKSTQQIDCTELLERRARIIKPVRVVADDINEEASFRQEILAGQATNGVDVAFQLLTTLPFSGQGRDKNGSDDESCSKGPAHDDLGQSPSLLLA
jgi:hypothetical protein